MEDKEELKKKLDSILAKTELPIKKSDVVELEKQTSTPDFWTDPKKASQVMKKIADLKKEIDDIEMMQLLFEENNLIEAEKLINQYDILLFLSENYDNASSPPGWP